MRMDTPEIAVLLQGRCIAGIAGAKGKVGAQLPRQELLVLHVGAAGAVKTPPFLPHHLPARLQLMHPLSHKMRCLQSVLHRRDSWLVVLATSPE